MENDNNQSEINPNLTDEEYQVLYQGATEPPFSGAYWDLHEDGIYHCRGCGVELFSADTKFDSGTGWPSFTEPSFRENVELLNDDSLGMRRIEARCSRCHGHLGHVFSDGPDGKDRWCINSAALQFTGQAN